jgi:hypothetical protein
LIALERDRFREIQVMNKFQCLQITISLGKNVGTKMRRKKILLKREIWLKFCQRYETVSTGEKRRKKNENFERPVKKLLNFEARQSRAQKISSTKSLASRFKTSS